MASTQSPDTTSINLNRLLSRLEQQLLSPNPDPRLQKHSYERTKTGANLEYARSLLLQLEHNTPAQKTTSRKTALQADLTAKRELIKRLNQRLYELNQQESDSDTGSADTSDDEEDLFPSYAPAHKNTEAGIETRQDPGQEELRSAAETLTSTLSRRRQGAATTTDDESAATGTDLFDGRNRAPHSTTDTLLSHNANEQEVLTSSLLTLAQQLKSQSVQFGASLESDKSALAAATQGLDKNAMGMESAGKRMGTLRRMTEGKGWFARLKLYGLIAGLWVLAFLLVFVGPKFRF